MTTTESTKASPKKSSSKKASKKKDAIVVKETAAVAVYADYGDDAGAGYSDETANDIQIPRIAILQALSPQVEKPVSEGGLDGAKPGLFLHTLDNSMTEHVDFVIGKIEKCYNEWIPRDNGGGFVARHELGSDMVREAKEKTPRGTIELANGNELLETVLMYVIPLDKEGQPSGGFAVLDFTKSKLSAWRSFNTLLRSFTIPQPGGRKVAPPIFAHMVRATTKRQAFDKGTAYNYVLSSRLEGDAKKSAMEASLIGPDHIAFRNAKELADLVEQGFAKVQDMGVEDAPSSDDESAAPF
jgi:hypothetical protein